MNFKQIKLQRESVIDGLEQDVTVYTQKVEIYASGVDKFGDPVNPVEIPTTNWGNATTIKCNIRYLTAEQKERRRFGNIKSAMVEFYCLATYYDDLVASTKITYSGKEWQVFTDDNKQMTIQKIRVHNGTYDRIRCTIIEKL